MFSPLHRSASRFRASILLSLLGACGNDFETHYEWEGEHIHFLSEHEDPPCAGTMLYLDTYTAILQQTLSSDASVTYHWLGSPESLDSVCPDGAAGCSTSNLAYSLSPIHLHEIVHALEPTHPAGNKFFTEGLATILGDTYYAPPVSMLASLSETEQWTQTNEQYGIAAHFTSFLVARYGLDRVRDFAKEASIADEGAELAFANFFDTSAAELFALYTDYPACKLDTLHIPLYECLIDNSPPSSVGLWTFENTLSCDGEQTIGPHKGRVYTMEAFEFVETNLFRIELQESDPKSKTQVKIIRCSPCEAQDMTELRAGENYAILTRGKYYIVTSQQHLQPSPYKLTVESIF